MATNPVIAAKIERLRGLANAIEFAEERMSDNWRNDVAKELDRVIGYLEFHVELTEPLP